MKRISAFTLAEVVVALIVIGVLAVLTIPQQMKGVEDAKKRSAYKKVMYSLSNITSIEVGSQNGLTNANYNSVLQMFNALVSNLNVKDFYAAPASIEALNEVYNSDFLYSNANDALDNSSSTVFSPWINTQDNISYVVGFQEGATCTSKLNINAARNYDESLNRSCVFVIVDLDGIAKGVNDFDPQHGNSDLAEVEKLNLLTGDRYYVFIGSDGATAGSRANTVEGKIVFGTK